MLNQIVSLFYMWMNAAQPIHVIKQRSWTWWLFFLFVCIIFLLVSFSTRICEHDTFSIWMNWTIFDLELVKFQFHWIETKWQQPSGLIGSVVLSITWTTQYPSRDWICWDRGREKKQQHCMDLCNFKGFRRSKNIKHRFIHLKMEKTNNHRQKTPRFVSHFHFERVKHVSI